ncbi:MAG: dTMP kinase [Defluviicoccus sp.]
MTAAAPTAPQGKFITLEGGEGAGKSTQAALLTDALRSAGIGVVSTREPGGTEGAEAIRSLLINAPDSRWSAVSEVLLHYAARREHLDKVILPALGRGACVVCDRFADSTMAYQGYGLGCDRQMISALHQLVVGTFRPDLTLVLDVEPGLGHVRAAGRGQPSDRYERLDGAFHERVRAGFLAIARAEPERCVIIAGTGTVAEVAQRIRRTVAERLRIGSIAP